MDSEYLTLEQVNTLLPENLRIDLSVKHIHRVIYTTVNQEYMPVATSRIAVGDSFSRIMYNTITDFYISLGCKFVCFIVGTKGIILLPIDVLKQYNRYSGWKADTKKGRQYWVRGKVMDDAIILTNSNDYSQNVDATPYFIAFNE